MDKRLHLLSTLTGLALGLTIGTPAQTAVTQPAGEACQVGQTAEECACEAALKANTIEALEDFLYRYHGPTA